VLAFSNELKNGPFYPAQNGPSHPALTSVLVAGYRPKIATIIAVIYTITASSEKGNYKYTEARDHGFIYGGANERGMWVLVQYLDG